MFGDGERPLKLEVSYDVGETWRPSVHDRWSTAIAEADALGCGSHSVAAKRVRYRRVSVANDGAR